MHFWFGSRDSKLCNYKIHHFIDAIGGIKNCKLSSFVESCTNDAGDRFKMNYFKIIFGQKPANFSRDAGFYELLDVRKDFIIVALSFPPTQLVSFTSLS